MNETDFLTIAQAAERLSVSIPRLRRILARPEFANRTGTVSRETRTGTRTGTGISLSLLAELTAYLNDLRVKTPAGNGNENRNENGNGNGITPAPFDELAILHRRIIEEQAARISDLQTALDAERQQAARLSDALAAALSTAARSQALQAIAAPKTPQTGEKRPWWAFWKKEGRE